MIPAGDTILIRQLEKYHQEQSLSRLELYFQTADSDWHISL